MDSTFARLLSSRKVWVAVVAFAAALFAVLGLSEDKAKPLVVATSLLGVAVVGAIGYEDGREKGKPGNVAPSLSEDAQRKIPSQDNAGPPSVNGLIFALLGVPLLALLGGCGSPATAYIQGDRATFDAVAPEYGAYVAADPNLTTQQQARRQRTIETWRMRLTNAERLAAEATTQPAEPSTVPEAEFAPSPDRP